ncbi:c-type cytochrome [Enterobacteriaceae bacterium RIT697]|uniref:c-type cytochrome n=1 Tax=Pantoea endophytica TaxID=92488 RepID=UPI0012AD4146|nr:cytochrome c [Pantoea endophytica]MRT24938.1 c-type cytochrome [Enterobacteriaceae bacterium RIT697]
MKVKTIVGGLVGLGVIAAGYGVGVTIDLNKHYANNSEPLSGQALEEKIARGAYVAVASDCVACHTSDPHKPFAGGYKIDTPFGPILSSNITSDKETGIGRWNKGQFDAAVRHGKGSHGYLYPAMPYPAYSRLTDNDLDDLWAYMQTIAPVKEKVVENQLPFPYNQRWLLGGWNLMFSHGQPFIKDPSRSMQINRGAYLAEGPGHCAACHTAKNILGGDKKDAMQGVTLQGWHAPDLTNNSHVGLGSWSKQDIVDYLHDGTNRVEVASGPMAEAVENSTQHMTREDLAAIAAYLKTLPASSASVPAALTQDSSVMNIGKKIYDTQCAACHISSGAGVSNMIPTLAGNPQLNASDPASLLTVILAGSDGAVTLGNPTAARMPSFGWKLSDQQVAEVTTYIRNSWGNAASVVSADDVAQARKLINATKH